jgi:Tfp pilus assembly protein PilO
VKTNISGEMGVKIATWLGIIGMLAGIALILLFPKPSQASVRATQRSQETKIKIGAEQANKDLATAKTQVDAHIWSGGAEAVGPGTLQVMNSLATKYKVKLSGFRPERTTNASGLDMLPYSVTATGAYLDVLNFAKAIENPDNKLAVDSLQVASSEANSDQVIATIGITAYRVREETKHA